VLGAFCLGCCWSLMLVLAAFGVMNLWPRLSGRSGACR
ncbi:copper chaperone, partial [Streptomyces sp. NPDC004009]